MKNSEIGTWVDGILSTSDIDSSGERIDLEGVDFSSVFDQKDAALNWEHKNDTPSQIVGKIIDVVRILKKSDCKNPRHEYFWKMNRERPYIYICGVLFDKLGHTAAKDAAALFSFADITKESNGKSDIGFSIEGSRLQKDGNTIKKCIMRLAAITQKPCNKSCLAEKMPPEDVDKYTKTIAKKKVQDSMKKSMQEESDLKKTAYSTDLAFKLKPKKPSKKMTYSKITPATGENRPGKEIEPKKVIPAATAPKDVDVGTRIEYKKKGMRTGAQIYNDPETWKSEKKLDLQNPLRKAVMKKENKMEKAKVDQSMPWGEKRKARRARNEADKEQKGVHLQVSIGEQGESKARPYKAPASVERQLPGTNASYKKRAKDAHDKVLQEQKQMPKPNLPKSEILKSLANEAWENFKHKDLLIDSIKKSQPNLSDTEVLAFAKTYSYIDMKKKEGELQDLFEKSKTDAGLSPDQKRTARQKRNEEPDQDVYVPSEAGAPNYQDKHTKTPKADKKRMRSGLTNFDPSSPAQRKRMRDIHAEKMKRIKERKPNLPKSEGLGKSEVILYKYDDGTADLFWGEDVSQKKLDLIVKKELSDWEEVPLFEKKEFQFKSKHKSDKGGLTEKGRKAYNKATGSNLKRPQPEGGKRKKSFCARNKGQIDMHNIDCRKTPDKRACKAGKRWKC